MKKARPQSRTNSSAPSYRPKIAVLCGGISPEREISLRSGQRVAEALLHKGYRAVTVDPAAEYCEKQMVFGHKSRHCRRQRQRLSTVSTLHRDAVRFTQSALQYCQKADKVFIALHGDAGEDGRIAATLECLGIQHTGSDHRGLCLSMDKSVSKQIMTQSCIPTPEYKVFSPAPPHAKEQAISNVTKECPFPCVIKPTCGGSSIGVEIAENTDELTEILKTTDSTVLIEKRIIGREFTVGILCGKALAVTEIIPRSDFYDYKNKYKKGEAKEITPASIPKELEDALKAAALATHNALHLGTYSRVDLMVEKETEQVYVLEANAIPGMTETSLLPQGAAATGMDFDTLCEKILTAKT